MRTTWFVISPYLAAVNQVQFTKLQLFGSGSLGLCAKEKKHSHKPKSQPVRNKKIEKTHAKEKQSHAQENIYIIRQFAYVHGVVGISLLSGKSIEYNLRLQCFSLYKTWQHNLLKILITKVGFDVYIMGQKNFLRSMD